MSIFLSLLVLLSAGIAQADVLVRGAPAADGYVESLQVDGVEFLEPSVDISRGTYIYQKGVVALNAPDCQFDLDYGELRDGAMTVTVTNRSGAAANFFAILRQNVEACTIDGSDLRSTRPLTGKTPARQSSWHLSGSVLEVSGEHLLWPWKNDTTVVELALPAGKSAALSFSGRRATPEELELLRELPNPPLISEADLAKQAPPPLELYSPSNWQVFQRDRAASGMVRISGFIHSKADSPVAHISGSDSSGAAVDMRVALAVDPNSGGLDQLVRVPAGGWYRLELSAAGLDHPVIVGRFGVGEVFVTAGQSNSTNSGQYRTSQQSGMVSAFNGLDWRKGDDPFWGTHDNSTGGSTWAALGDILYEKYKVPVGFAVTGHGGTNTRQWLPDNDKAGLFHHTMVRVWQLGPHGFRALLWHQGESDVQYNSTEETYGNMLRIIRASRQAAGWPIPWFVAKVSYRPEASPQLSEQVRDAHQRLWDEGVAQQGPDTDLLLGEYRDYDGKGIHFSPAGLRRMAEMWAEQIAPWLDRQLQ